MRILVIDTETTGIDCNTDTVLELAGVDPFGDYQFESLCYYDRPIDPTAKAVHHILEHQVADPTLLPFHSNLIYMLQDFEPDVLVAHNAPFDKGFFDKSAKIECDWIDTLRVAKHLLPEAPGFSDNVLRYYLNLDVSPPEGLAPHRALYDTIVTAHLFRTLYMLVEEKLNKETPEEAPAFEERIIAKMIQLSSAPALLHRLTFGKHRGKLFSDVRRVEPGYLRWMSTAADIDPDARHTAVTLLRQR